MTRQRTWLELGTHVQVCGKAIQMIVHKPDAEGPTEEQQWSVGDAAFGTVPKVCSF